MAEWAILILVFGVIGGAYALSQRVFETWQVLSVWVAAGLIIVIALIAYVFAKVDKAASPWAEQYHIEEQ